MTRVLFLAWYFPPVGGAGVQRSLKFARHLPAHGVHPVVLAGPAEIDGRWAPVDPSLFAEVPEDLQLHRAPPLPPASLAQRLRWRFGGELRVVTDHWRRFVLATGPAAARAHDCRAFVVTLGPFECLAGALDLGERLDLPVIADLRDPWALDEMRAYTHRWQRRCDLARMRRQLARCRAVVMNTPTAADLARSLGCVPGDRVHCVTNGYDADDFAGAPPAAADDGTFRIVHTGYLHTDSALRHDARSPLRRRLLGGERPGLDLWGRTHRYLLAALDRLGQQAPAVAARVELHLHGVLSAGDEAEIDRSPQRDRVRRFGYRPHAETVTAMREADLLFLPMQGLPAGERATIVPGKTYEYLAAGRPILAAVPDGDARDFVRAADAGPTVHPDDVDGLASALRRCIERGRVADRPLGEAVQRFERRRLAAQLAAIVHGALQDGGPPPISPTDRSTPDAAGRGRP